MATSGVGDSALTTKIEQKISDFKKFHSNELQTLLKSYTDYYKAIETAKKAGEELTARLYEVSKKIETQDPNSTWSQYYKLLGDTQKDANDSLAPFSGVMREFINGPLKTITEKFKDDVKDKGSAMKNTLSFFTQEQLSVQNAITQTLQKSANAKQLQPLYDQFKANDELFQQKREEMLLDLEHIPATHSHELLVCYSKVLSKVPINPDSSLIQKLEETPTPTPPAASSWGQFLEQKEKDKEKKSRGFFARSGKMVAVDVEGPTPTTGSQPQDNPITHPHSHSPQPLATSTESNSSHDLSPESKEEKEKEKDKDKDKEKEKEKEKKKEKKEKEKEGGFGTLRKLKLGFTKNPPRKTSSPQHPSQLDEPKTSKASDWVEYVTDDGITYFYNTVTQESRWDIPAEVQEQRAQQQQTSEAASTVDDASIPVPLPPPIEESVVVNSEEKTEEQPVEQPAEQPAEQTPTSGGEWIEYTTDDGHIYYHNEQTGETKWKTD
eukprot:TRINITY_DN13488_c0_g1_i1.p1 TRINITY_DN13488_c0_g1~~TRINITY_DN13488_c0_g1_i1.p1  ORF type:complete len:494 (+),score=155.20 TRINITY_DN13488_c0_g1_i1:104-1585(+)